MLESMIENPRPTRAEASDVANAVIDGADCVMLSGETSIGKYPFDTVGYMHRIIKAVEDKFGNKFEAESPRECLSNISDALSKASCVIAQQINASAIVTSTSKGYTATNIAKYRPDKPILALTENVETVRQLSLVWGVSAMLLMTEIEAREVFADPEKYLFGYGFIKKGDYVVYATGYTTKSGRDENLTKVYHV
jgi:pyruvate kinase